MTDAGVMDCKRALEEASGDVDRAREILYQKGLAAVAKRATRTVNEGRVEGYVHSGNRIAALVEVNCETDFVARTEMFQELAHDLAMQVAAMGPMYLSAEELPADEFRNPEEICLLRQQFIKDPSRTIQDLVDEVQAKTGEKVDVRRFVRFALGQ